jgi:hypothetical protein
MNNPEKKERKQRIKAQNAKAKKIPPPPMLSGGKHPEPRKPMTDEEFHDQLFGFFLIVEGFCRLAGLYGKGFTKDQFPSELDVE